MSACSHHLVEGIKAKVSNCATESLHDLDEKSQQLKKKYECELQQCYVSLYLFFRKCTQTNQDFKPTLKQHHMYRKYTPFE